MALNIKDEETDRLVRRLAATTGESITVATRIAVQERLARLQRRPTPTSAHDQALAIIRRARLRTPHPEQRSDNEILGYGEDGLPA